MSRVHKTIKTAAKQQITIQTDRGFVQTAYAHTLVSYDLKRSLQTEILQFPHIAETSQILKLGDCHQCSHIFFARRPLHLWHSRPKHSYKTVHWCHCVYHTKLCDHYFNPFWVIVQHDTQIDRQIRQLYRCCICRRGQWRIQVTFNVEAIRPPCAVIYPLNSWEVKEEIQIWRNIQNQSNFNHKRISQLKRTTCWKWLLKGPLLSWLSGCTEFQDSEVWLLVRVSEAGVFHRQSRLEISSLTPHARPSKLCTNPADCTC